MEIRCPTNTYGNFSGKCGFESKNKNKISTFFFWFVLGGFLDNFCPKKVNQCYIPLDDFFLKMKASLGQQIHRRSNRVGRSVSKQLRTQRG